jgi:hypothetical protein
MTPLNSAFALATGLSTTVSRFSALGIARLHSLFLALLLIFGDHLLHILSRIHQQSGGLRETQTCIWPSRNLSRPFTVDSTSDLSCFRSTGPMSLKIAGVPSRPSISFLTLLFSWRCDSSACSCCMFWEISGER